MKTYENGDWIGMIDDPVSRAAILYALENHVLPGVRVYPCGGSGIIGMVGGRLVMSQDVIEMAAEDGVLPISIDSN